MPTVAVAVAVVSVAVVAGLALAATVALCGWGSGDAGPAPVLSARAVAATVAAADALAADYVDDSWCHPLLAGTVGTTPAWPGRLAAPADVRTLVVGPPQGLLTTARPPAVADLSDVRAVLPPPGHAWSVRPRFCVFEAAYPRLVTSGGRSHPQYPPLPRRLTTLQQIFGRFPAYRGRVTLVAVPVTVEVAYALSVDGGAWRNFHLIWRTSLGMVPVAHGPALRLRTWAIGGAAAPVTVQHDVPLGPVAVQARPPGSGP